MVTKFISKDLAISGIDNILLRANGNNSRIEKFKKDSRVICLCTEHNSSGISLTEANHVILYDTAIADDYKKIEKKAVSVAARFGQTKKITVKKFIIKGTEEDRS